jgi:hypothetical protein
MIVLQSDLLPLRRLFVANTTEKLPIFYSKPLEKKSWDFVVFEDPNAKEKKPSCRVLL